MNQIKAISRYLPPLLLFALVLITGMIDPAVAGNKLNTIGGGVSGVSREKIAMLKDISGYAGGLLIVISMASLLTRRRYEGSAMIASKKRWEASIIVPLILITIGLGMLWISFT